MKILNEKEIEEAARKIFKMEIIPKQENKEAAWKYANQYNKEVIQAAYADFIEGSLFAQNKLIPLMTEFVEWCAINFCPIVNDSVKYWVKGSFQNKQPRYTTQQLLEQFIKSKQETK